MMLLHGPGLTVSQKKKLPNSEYTTILAGQKVPPSYSNWNEMAVPNITGHRLNCMQYLSGTEYGKENSKSSEQLIIPGRTL